MAYSYYSYHETTMTGQAPAGRCAGTPAYPGTRYQDPAGGHLDAPSAVAGGSIEQGLWDYPSQKWGPDLRPVPSIAGRW